MGTFDQTLKLSPRELHKARVDIEKELTCLVRIPKLTIDIDELVRQFNQDTETLKVHALVEKWRHRKRSIRALLLCSIGTETLRSRRRALIHLMRLFIKELLPADRYLKYIGIVALNLPAYDDLWSLFGREVTSYSGRSQLITTWRENMSVLRNPLGIAQGLTVQGYSIKDTLHNLRIENTVVGEDVVSATIEMLGAWPTVSLKHYYSELFGAWQGQTIARMNMGLLAQLPIERLARFVNKYCNKRRDEHDEFVLEYLKSENVLGSVGTSNTWLNPSIEKSTREFMRQWYLRRDFTLAFDEILKHEERKVYWKRWLDAGLIDDIRIFSPRASMRVRHMKLDRQIEHLEYPTMFIKIRNCLAIECGAQGMGGVYIYPIDGPVKWNVELRRARSYKSPILDSRYVDQRWRTISHHIGWQKQVDLHLLRTYGLRRNG